MKELFKFITNLILTVILVSQSSVILANSKPLTFSIVTEQLVIQKMDISKINILSGNQLHGVEIKLTQSATKKLNKLTRLNMNKRMQLSIDDTIIGSPVIRSEISSTFQISMENAELAQKLYDTFKQ